MVITMELKHVIKRGEKYYFRMLVPKDCIEKFGKTEIVIALKTSDPLAAKAAAGRFKAFWADRFEKARESKSPVSAKQSPTPPDEDSETFQQRLLDLLEKNLPGILKVESNKELRDRLDFYEGGLVAIGENSQTQFDFPEIGIQWPLKTSKSPGLDRLRKKILCGVLQLMCTAVAQELGIGSKAGSPKNQPKRTDASSKKEPETTSAQERSITAIVELMIDAKKVPEKTAVALRADVKLLKEWCGGKDDLSSYTKRDLIDFMQNALPYLPVNMKKKKSYTGKPVTECVALTKSDLQTYKPISHRTCENRQANLSSVFNYAKDHLGLITINPARDIEIPKIRVTAKHVRGYSPQELTAMWTALEDVHQETRYPSRYWATVLSLYHGFRLNEVCSLFLKDVYEDEDGVFVIDINEDGPLKTVKNPGSGRVVPVHPFVRDQLGFRAFVAEQKSARSDGVLFTNVTGTERNGYIRQTSFWFAEWKKEWLPADTQYKHFHDMRYTFTQNAQNIAKMPDRHAQEITGHAIEGVSAVHLGYSGRLKPAALLEELQKVQYGWESSAEPARALPTGTPRPVQRPRRTEPCRVVKRSALDPKN